MDRRNQATASGDVIQRGRNFGDTVLPRIHANDQNRAARRLLRLKIVKKLIGTRYGAVDRG